MRPFLKVKKFVSISENVGNGLKIDSRYGEHNWSFRTRVKVRTKATVRKGKVGL